MTDDATGQPAPSEETLARALAAAHDALAAKIALIELEQASGELSPELAAQQAAAAMAVYDRDCALARVAAETGWERGPGSVGCCTPAVPHQPAEGGPRGRRCRAARADRRGLPVSGPLDDVAGVLEDEAGLLGVSLAQWAYRDEARDRAAAIRAGGTALDTIDGMLRRLRTARSALVAEIRQDQDRRAARVDAMLAERHDGAR